MKIILLLMMTVVLTPSSSSWAMEKELPEFLTSPAILALNTYQRYISPMKGSSCPMDPSCSAYARQAIQRHGILFGSLQTADRLNRCGHDLGHYPLRETPRGLKWLDPVP